MVLYRSRDLVITDRSLLMLPGPRARYEMRHLTDVHVVCNEFRHAGAHAAPSLGALAVVLLLVSVLFDAPIMLGIALVTLGASATAGVWSRRRRTWELRARHRHIEISLFATADERKFGQVKRAVIRALEANERW